MCSIARFRAWRARNSEIWLTVEGQNASGIEKMAYTFPFVGLLAAIAAGLIFGVLAALMPARQASQMEIIKALRYE